MRRIAAIFGAIAFGFTPSAFAQETSSSSWDCYLSNQNRRHVGTVDIWWGHTPGDAAWACNNWISECGNNGGCRANHRN